MAYKQGFGFLFHPHIDAHVEIHPHLGFISGKLAQPIDSILSQDL